MELLHYACLLHEVVHQHGQTVAWSGFSETKYVKVPVALCILHNIMKYHDISSEAHSCSTAVMNSTLQDVKLLSIRCDR